MSKFGMKIGDKEYNSIEDPILALELIEHIIGQFFGPIWTQYKPKCPLCDHNLADFEKNMNKPIGECNHPNCQSTIFNGDYFGKMRDVIDEWNYHKDTYIKLRKELEDKAKEEANAPKNFKKITAKSVSNPGTTLQY